MGLSAAVVSSPEGLRLMRKVLELQTDVTMLCRCSGRTSSPDLARSLVTSIAGVSALMSLVKTIVSFVSLLETVGVQCFKPMRNITMSCVHGNDLCGVASSHAGCVCQCGSFLSVFYRACWLVETA